MADRCEFELSLTVGLRRLARWSSGRARRDRCEVDRCRCDRCEVDRSRFGCWKSFVLSLVGRIGALGCWIDRGLVARKRSFSRSLAGSELWVAGNRSSSRSSFFLSLVLSSIVFFLFFLSRSRVVFSVFSLPLSAFCKPRK